MNFISPAAGGSFSKTAGFTGVRCGYTVVPARLAREGVSLNKLWARRQSTKFNGVSYITQMGAAAVFTEEGERQIREKCMALLEFVGLEDKASVAAKNLPYGDQRRLEIARALATEPKLLLLDEPAAGMNSSEKVALSELIRRIQEKGISILQKDRTGFSQRNSGKPGSGRGISGGWLTWRIKFWKSIIFLIPTGASRQWTTFPFMWRKGRLSR